MASQGLPADGVRIRLLGLIAGLIVFWIDAQINFTLLSGHLVAYSIAALLIGATMVENTSGKVIATVEVEKLDPWVFEFGIGMVLVATFASFLSPVGGEAGEEMLQVASRCVLPIIVFLAAGLLRGNMVESSDRHSVRWFMFTVGLPLAYLMAHLLMRPSLGEGFEIAYVDRIAETRLLIVIFLLLASMLLLVKVRAGNSASVRMRMGIVDLGIHAGILAILVVFVGMAWRALVGDVAAGSAQLVDVKDRHTIDELAEIAVSAAPWEWRHHSDLIYRRLGHALADLTPAGVSPERASDFRRELGKAETAAYMAVERFENEPWAVLSLAKVLQVRALSVIRPLYPESGAAAVAAADAAFEKAHWMFPAQPLTLHGWAQLKFDNGDVLEGYRLLDRMEAIIPGEPEPYVERIAAAIRVRDQSTMTQTLVRARSMLTMEQAESLARYSESLQKQ
jgi:hypothetical protein